MSANPGPLPEIELWNLNFSTRAPLSLTEECLRLGNIDWQCRPSVQVTLYFAFHKPVAALSLLGSNSLPLSSMISPLVRRLLKVWETFFLHSSVPRVQASFWILLFPFLLVLPKYAEGFFLSLLGGCLRSSVTVLLSSYSFLCFQDKRFLFKFLKIVI